VLLTAFLFLVCCGLGYPILNRASWRNVPALADVESYASLVTAPPTADVSDHMQFRILVPIVARPFYWLANGRVGSWDPVMFGLLISDSLFTTGTAMLLLLTVWRLLGSYSSALGAALIYLLNYAVPNLRLAGLVDAGEGFFLMLMVWALLEEKHSLLPICGLFGALAKESFAPFLIVFTISWWLFSRPAILRATNFWVCVISSWVAAIASLVAVRWHYAHSFQSPMQLGAQLHRNTAYFAHLFASIADRQLWYIFIWLLPLSLVKLRNFPRNWRWATAATAIAAAAMNSWHGAAPGTLGRALFSIAGPLLSASVAVLLFTPPAPANSEL
ncbi:MAG TPA: hypothetical protein VF786_07000, partial [Terriglobales bacterium]